MNRARQFGIQLALLAWAAAGAQAQQAGDAAQPAPNAVAAKDSADSATKPKKVWTDVDVRHSGGKPENVKQFTNSRTTAIGKDAQAARLKEQLTKLQAQLDDTDRKLAELRKFNGDNAPDTAIRLNHGLNRTSVADQITKLEAKKKQLQEQIQNNYDQARRSGIEPGALR